MSKSTIIGLVVVLVLIAAGIFLITERAKAPTAQNPYQGATYDAAAGLPPSNGTGAAASSSTSVANQPVSTATSATVVTYTDAGFSPASVTMPLGGTVRFVNNSSRMLWVASNPHPIHNGYDGTTMQQHCGNGVDTMHSFDECTSIPAGSVYSFTFERTGSFGYHNHMHISDMGTVVVK